MIKKIHILLIALVACTALTSCDGNDDDIDDAILGKWYVNAVSHAGYRMSGGYDPMAENYFINFFYGDYMPFLKGDILDFGSFDMKRSAFDGKREQYNYTFYGNSLGLDNGYKVSYGINSWSNEQIVITFDKNSLLDYITSDMYYASSSDHYNELAYIRGQVERYVNDFYIEYVLTRNEPSVSQIISGNYYGQLSDNDGPLFNNGWVSASLYRQNYQSINFVLNDQISLLNGPLQGPPFNVEVPGVRVSYGNAAGQIVLEGSSYISHSTYGRIDVYIAGQSFDSQTLDIDLEIRNNGLIYNLYFRNGIRYLLEPQTAYRSRSQQQPREKQVIPLRPTKNK